MDHRLFLCDNKQNILNAYQDEQLQGSLILTGEELRAGGPHPEIEAVFSTWGMPRLTEDEISSLLPGLRCVFYAAGTVQAFARPFLNKGVRVFSAWAANAVPVAEFTLGQILWRIKDFSSWTASTVPKVSARQNPTRDTLTAIIIIKSDSLAPEWWGKRSLKT